MYQKTLSQLTLNPRTIERILGRPVLADAHGVVIGLGVADLEAIELVVDSWRRAVKEDRRIIRATLDADRVAAGLYDAEFNPAVKA